MVGMSECHKTKTTKLWDSGSERAGYGSCRHCERDLASDSQDWCRFCAPPEARVRIFQLRLPIVTLELIKARHGNVSAVNPTILIADVLLTSPDISEFRNRIWIKIVGSPPSQLCAY